MNAVGWGPLSALAPLTHLVTLPSAPLGVSAAMNAANTAVVVSYGAPASDGGSAVTRYACYAYSAAGGGPVVTYGSTTSTSSCILSAGLVPGTEYFFGVRAMNAVGWGPLSALAPLTFTPVTLPSAPLGVSAAMNAANTAVVVSYGAPASDGGSPVTRYACYAYSAAGGGGGRW